jgi:hypothetical protein
MVGAVNAIVCVMAIEGVFVRYPETRDAGPG